MLKFGHIYFLILSEANIQVAQLCQHIWSEMQSLILTESIKLRGENVFVVDKIWRGFPNINVEITNKNWIKCF